ncbi:hypothetical protein HG263_14820 [Pseudoalteromonas sp. JBTF-M23]|uniref:Uncharacterized protein n=1 Tax=Pseudoalteromonas caenipelagi TaxID=2726988 RepID=A0A849VGG2_9GAMM|nr:hypothetical protein [Pseudoalteromonas caenipelagi]NOU51808.1 hypothetical protein [Pseudoalteromonas caenipelagi]
MNILSKLKRAILNYLSSKASYFDGNHYSIEPDEFRPIQATRAICIVARNKCIESTKSYTSISKKELYAIIDLEKKASENFVSYRVIESRDNESFEVHKTEFDITEEQATSSWVLIPESFLIGQCFKGKLVSIDTLKGKLYVYMLGTLHCLYHAGLIRSIETFKHSIGLPDNIQEIQLETSQYAAFLRSGIYIEELQKNHQAVCLNVKSKFSLATLHALYIAPLLTFSTALLVTVAFQYHALSQNEGQINSSSDEVNEVLRLSNKVKSINKDIELVNEQIANAQLVSEHWDILNLLIEKQVKFNFIRYERGRMVIDGEVKDSTALLRGVNDSPLVESAEYSGAINKSQELDKFNMNISLTGQDAR